MRAVIAAGGTGGHIYPALALADAICRDPASEVLFIGADDRMEARIIPDAGYPFKSIHAQGFNGSSHDKLKALLMNARARKACLKILEEFRPDIAAGFGNYVTVPVIEAAHRLGVPIILHEQNSIAGLANRYLARLADKIVICYPSSASQFPKRKLALLGNPRASAAAAAPRDRDALRKLGLDPQRKTVLIVMGSLGSSSVNAKLIELLGQTGGRPYQLIYVTGRDNYSETARQIKPAVNLCIRPYIDQIPIMAVSDLVVSRGGATSAAEITALQVPSIIIPSPYVPNNHQHFNAQAMVQAGCAVEVTEDRLTPESFLSLIDELIADDRRLARMRSAARALGFPQATEDMLSLMTELAVKK